MRLIDADALLIKIDEANYTAIDIKNLIAEAQTVEQDSGEAVAWVGYKPQSNGTYFPVLFLEKPNPINLINIEPLYTSPPKREWRGLSDEDVLKILDECADPNQ